MKFKVKTAAAALLVFLSTSALATDGLSVYSKLGLPGFTIGTGYNFNENFGVRADYATLGSITYDFDDDDISYQAKLKNDKINLALDYFPFANGFRLTSGIGLLPTKLTASGHGKSSISKSFTIGDQKYDITIDGNDSVNAEVKYSSVSPYLGLGYGHHIKQGKGEWGFLFDFGVYFSKPRTSLGVSSSLYDKLLEAEKTSGRDLSQAKVEIDNRIEAEKASLQDKVGKIKMLPALSFGVSYHF